MLSVLLFGEDYGHEMFVSEVIRRIGDELGRNLRLSTRSCTRGYGRVVHELRQLSNDIARGEHEAPDVIVVAADANRVGRPNRTRALRDALTRSLQDRAVFAIPDPHIERWMLVDSHAFKQVFGRGCDAPDQRSERGRYKKALLQAIRTAGHDTLIGGMEYAPEIVSAMDLSHVLPIDESLGAFVADFRRKIGSTAR